jgi:DNA replication ATP-dependent helicase Dna2
MVVNRQITNYGTTDKTGGEGSKENKIHRYTYSFFRSRTWVPPPSDSPTQSPTSTRSLLNGHLNIGDPITVSIEPKLLALARGYILELTPEEIVLGVDHVLDVVSLKKRVQQMHSADGSELVFRIDKDELFGGMARVRSNLAQLFYAGGDARRLSLVVDLRKPIFSAPTPPFSATPAKPSPSHLAHLNPSQLDAMHKVLSAEDYALILGMPGTGKTTVIAALIRELVSRGKTVLLSSYTHSAVDTILMKLDNEGGGKDGAGSSFGVLRLGNVDKVRPSFVSFLVKEM